MKNNKIEQRVQALGFTIEKRDGEEQGNTITGYASNFDNWSNPIWGQWIEKIARGAFDGCDMTEAIACFNHDPDKILARTSSGTLKLEVDEVGLKFTFDIPDTTAGRDLKVNIERGDVSRCSFMFIVESDAWTFRDKDNGLEYDQRTITKISALYDVSPVVRPAYPDTEVQVRSVGAHEERRAEYFKALEEPKDEETGATSRSRKIRLREIGNNL